MKTPANIENAHVDEPSDARNTESYLKLAQQFAKVMAISDMYQAEIMGMASELRRSKDELERTQGTLRQSEERFRALIDNLPVGVSMIGPDMEILAANPRMKAWFPEIGREPYRACGVLCPAQSTEASCAVSPLYKTWEDGKARCEEREVDTEVGRRTMRITTAAVRNADERITAVIEMAEDISERKQMERDREEAEARERSLQKADSLQRMAAAIAHHFNNQLQSVTGSLELALQDLSEKDPGRALLNGALLSARKAAEMSVLMRSYLGQSSILLGPTDLSEVCRQRLAGLRNALPQGYSLQEKLPDSGPCVTGNATQIEQILTSLFSNAWEAMEREDRPGVVRLSVATVPASAVPVAHRFPLDWQPADDAYGCLSVADTGPGLDEKAIERIFDPFFSEKFTGRGLGLSVVLGVMRGHGGAITVESVPGKGSTFRCYFPLAGEAAAG